MVSVFFDLETSDREPIGQIINFSFILIDDEWNVISDLSRSVRLSRLQLPSPSAILANRVNVEELQQTCTLTEREACREIAEFLWDVVNKSPSPVPFIGYNSFKFDVPYLRTTLIRNGMNPYFKGRLLQRDLLPVVRKLSLTHRDFPRCPAKDEPTRLSLRLETIAKALGLLEGAQLHSSKEDTLLTIAVAKELCSRFGLDVRSYDPYEASAIHHTTKRGEVYYHLEPQYDLNRAERVERVPCVLLDADRRYSLWANLNRYKEGLGLRAISLSKVNGGSCFMDRTTVPDPHTVSLATDARKEFSGVTLANYFSRSECDIEQDIYRIDFDGIEALGAAIWDRKREAIDTRGSRDLRTLYVRNVLANYRWGSGDDDGVKRRLRQYACYRYGGKLILSRHWHKDSGAEPETHPTFVELMSEAETTLATAEDDTERSLLVGLINYYRSSELLAVAEQDLIAPAIPE